MATPHPADVSLRVLSRIPGRVRWEVPSVRRRPRFAAAVAEDLARHPAVLEARANPVAGSVLLRFAPEHDADEAAGWLRGALVRQADVDREPAQLPATTTAAARPSPLARLLATTDRYPDLRRRAVAAAVADGLAEAIPPLLVGLAVGTAVQGPTSLLGRLGFRSATSRVAALVGIGAGFWALAAVLEYARERTSAELASRVRRDLRNQLYQHLQQLDVATIESRDAGEWSAVLDGDVEQVYGFIREGAEPMVAIASNVVVVGSTFAVAAPALGVIVLAVIPAVALASTAMLKPYRARLLVARRDNEQLKGMIAGNLTGMATVVGFNAEEREAMRVAEAADRHFASARSASVLSSAYVPTLRAIVGTGFVATLGLGVSRVYAGTLTAGALDSMAYAQLRLMAAVARVGTALENYQKTATALERIYATLDLEPGIPDGVLALPASGARGDLALEDVVFGYDPERPVLDGLTMRFPAGRTTGIVGSTGAGKSTVVKLLQRFYDPQSGTVRMGGTDLRELRLEDLRRAVAVVPQQITLFSGTIYENIVYGRADATWDEVVRAAQAAEAHDFISDLPQGYDTRIGFGGFTLSAGQRQRLAIARAVLADRPILLFDEATSSLDYVTEAAIQRSLDQTLQGRTTIIVAHRLSTVRNADVIYVLDDGRVIQSGRHDELLAEGGLYASMWRVQTGEARARPPEAA